MLFAAFGLAVLGRLGIALGAELDFGLEAFVVFDLVLAAAVAYDLWEGKSFESGCVKNDEIWSKKGVHWTDVTR